MRAITTFAVLVAALLLAACDGDDDAAPTDTPTATATSSATPPVTPTIEVPKAVADARLEFARWLGPAGDVNALNLAGFTAQTWPDGCLGLGHGDEACTEALVEGYEVTLTLGTGRYVVRSNADATVVRWAPDTQILVRFAESSTNLASFMTDDGSTIDTRLVPGTALGDRFSSLAPGDPVGIAIAPAAQAGAPPFLVWADPAGDFAATLAGDAALAVLAGYLTVDASHLEVASVEPVDWPDGCLGVSRPGIFCTQAIVPGFRVQVTLDGTLGYTLHTDRDARSIVWVGPLGGGHLTVIRAGRSEIEVEDERGARDIIRIVPGTDLTVVPQSLLDGDIVTITMAPDPDGEGFVAVTIDLLDS